MTGFDYVRTLVWPTKLINFYSRFQYGYLKTTNDTAVILTGGRLFIFGILSNPLSYSDPPFIIF